VEDAVRVKNLSVEFHIDRIVVPAVRDFSVAIPEGKIFGLIGESGSGKSTVAFAMVNQVPSPGHITSGSVEYEGFGSLYDKSDEVQRLFRWKHVSVVFQAAQNTLNPLMRVRAQIEDIARAHGIRHTSAVVEHARNLCRAVHLDPDRVLHAYPHELSGGMRQRVGVVLALLLNPKLIILDEPTTALDVLSQESVVDSIRRINSDLGLTILFITHDLSLIGELADNVGVMYAGRLVEQGPVRPVFSAPRHPYTQGLIRAIPPLFGDLSRVRPMIGQPPRPTHLPSGCPFHPRCPVKVAVCDQVDPPLLPHEDGRLVACHVARGNGGSA
jgi:peptide/nickel transport system ATP-binding protein